VTGSTANDHAPCPGDGRDAGLDDAVTGTGLAPVYQPIVSLASGLPIGFEALARWPGQPHLEPPTVFARAAATDRVSQLDRICIDRAVDHALQSGLTEGALLCVNSEPGSDYTGRADSEILDRGNDKFELLFELTERNLLEHLPTLLRKVDALRADGIAIAMDDVGAQPGSLALLDVICPDVIKIAMNVVQSKPGGDLNRTEAAILAHRERRNTVIIAEGIETDRHLAHALELGASLGQGYLYGRPGPLQPHTQTAPWSPPDRPTRKGAAASPFDVVSTNPGIRAARKPVLTAISRQLEEQALRAGDTTMVLIAAQHRRYFDEATRDRYAALAEISPLVMVFGQGIAADVAPGLRGVNLPAADPLCAEWAVLILGPHTAAALIARERRAPRGGSEPDRRFDYVVTHDRMIITAAARALLNRVP